MSNRQPGRRLFKSMAELRASFRHVGECWVSDLAIERKTKANPYSFQASIPDAPNCERLVHRALFMDRYPEVDVKHWSIVRHCGTEGCVNPEHYRRGMYNSPF